MNDIGGFAEPNSFTMGRVTKTSISLTERHAGTNDTANSLKKIILIGLLVVLA